MKKSIFLIKTFKIKNINILYNNINFKKDFISFRSKKKKFISLYYKFCNLLLNDKKINNILVKNNYKNFVKLNGLNICYIGYESSLFYKKNNNNFLSKVIILKSFKIITFDKTNNYLTFVFKIKNSKKIIKKSIIEIHRFFIKLNIKKNKKTKIITNFNKKYLKNFAKIKKLIYLGEIMQTQLSCKYHLNKKIHNIFAFYNRLIKYNFKELSFFFSYKQNKLIINSPETFLKNCNFLKMFPIAGTIRRGINIFSDKILERKLLKDKKENSEHNMLIDMTRNDLSSIRKTFNNEKISFKKVGKYFFLQHIVSKISSKKNYNFFKSIFNTFPAGTLTGSPKFKAMKIIQRTENFNREFYGGIIGFYKNNLYNMTIIIRALLIYKDNVFFQAASGIVKDSILKYEKKEINNKIKNIINIFNYI